MESIKQESTESNSGDLFSHIEQEAAIKFEELFGRTAKTQELVSFIMDILPEHLQMLHRCEPERQQRLFDAAGLNIDELFNNIPEKLIEFYKNRD